MKPLSPSTGTKSHISVDRFNAILKETTPLAAYLGIRAERIEVGEAWSRIIFSEAALRAGGTFSGPALMALIDVCMYAAVLGASGDDPRALTSNIAIIFLRRARERPDSSLQASKPRFRFCRGFDYRFTRGRRSECRVHLDLHLRASASLKRGPPSLGADLIGPIGSSARMSLIGT